MHTLGLGVFKNLFSNWFDGPANASYKFKKNEIKAIEIRYMKLRPPDYVGAAPRNISDYGIWKAKEFINFILLYSLPLFRGLMADQHFEHLTKLVVALEILTQKKIQRNNLPKAHKLLVEFVRDARKLYTDGIMTSGIHELLHLVECTEEIGPLVSLSAFPFEELNRKFLQFIKGRDLMGEEFFKLFVVVQELQSFVESYSLSSSVLKEFIINNTEIKTCNRKNRYIQNTEIKIWGKFDCPDLLRIVYDSDFVNVDSDIFYEHFNFKKVHYCKVETITKLNNSCISFEDFFGLIQGFFLKDDEPFVICKQILELNLPFFVPQFKLSHKSYSCYISDNDFFIAPAQFIQKVLLIKIDDELADKTYINFNSTSHFFT